MWRNRLVDWNVKMTRSSKRRKLFEKHNGICYWCNKPCEYHEMSGGGSPKMMEATIDHIYSDRDPRRPQFPGHYVLAHAKCNYMRANIENRAAETLWKALAPFIYKDGIVTHDPKPLYDGIEEIRQKLLRSEI